jgi:chitin biosynthesis protein CHS5
LCANVSLQIEFPSILLPPSITSGSIVDITVSQNHQAERKSQAAFSALQSRILNTYGLESPAAPVLRLRNATQTSLVLEWDPIRLATSTLRSLALYRNGSKAGNIPRPKDQLSTKISGLAVDTEYSFHLVLRTSGGTYTSNLLTVKTHKMTDLTGITITPGVLPDQLRGSLEAAVERIGARIVDTVRIDTTHFVCTEGRGRDWERAVEMSIPVVRPEWVEGCEREGKIVGVRGYYLDANPKNRQVGSNPTFAANQPSPTPASASAASQASAPSRPSPKSPERDTHRDEDGPGPEVPPTPPPKKYLPPTPTVEEENSDDEEDEEDEEEEQEQEGKITNKQANSASSAASEEEAEPQPAQRAKVEVEKDEEGSGDMDEVPL